MIKVLYIDDEPALFEPAKRNLEREEGTHVDTVADAEEALQALKRDGYDVIVSEYMMPGMNGIELLKALRESGNNTPFILFTCRGREEAGMESLNSGGDFYLNKGGDPKSQFVDLRKIIDQAVFKGREEKALQKACERPEELEEIINFSPAIVFLWKADEDWSVEYVSDNISMFGFKPDDFNSGRKKYASIIHPEDLPRVREEVNRYSMSGAESFTQEYRIVTGTGAVRWVDDRTWIRRENGEVTHYQGVILDATEKKLAERRLRESEQKYRTIFENTGTAMVVIEEDMTISLVNDEFVRLTGYSKEEVEGRMHSSDFVADRDKGATEKYHKLRRENPKLAPRRYEIGIRMKNGKMRDAIITIDLVPGMGQSIASLLDMNERKKLEKKLQRQTEEQRLLLDNVETMVWYVVDPETYGKVNQARADFLGRRKAEIEGKKLQEFLPPDEAEMGIKGNRKVFETKSPYHEFEWVTNGKGEKRLMSVTKVPKLDMKGDVEFVVCSGHDVTELRNAQDALDLANRKLHLLGGVTRHDIANQLTVISGGLQMVESSALSGKDRKYLDMALSAGRNVERYLEFSRDYERMGTAKPEWISVKDACMKGISTLEAGDIEVDIDLDDIEIYADRMLERVFHNLVGNSIRHGEKVTKIRIFHQQSDDSLLVICEDDGKGIPDEMKGGLFEGRRGRGLYLVKEILGITEMTIAEKGESGKGARFEIRVPKGEYRKRNETAS